VSELVTLREESLTTLIWENFLLKLSRHIYISTHTFIHRQLLRLLILSTHLTTREIIARTQQLVPDPSQLTKENYTHYKDLKPWYKLFIDRMNPRLNERNAKFIFDFMTYLDNPEAIQQRLSPQPSMIPHATTTSPRPPHHTTSPTYSTSPTDKQKTDSISAVSDRK
jgi:hypothetical protein